jgi:predicted RNA-binding Zn-ribbon protein involved in translation (DUF1610 family)
MAAKWMNYEQYSRQEDTLRLSCECGWEGKATDAYGELHEDLLDFECPECEKMLLIVNANRGAMGNFDPQNGIF